MPTPIERVYRDALDSLEGEERTDQALPESQPSESWWEYFRLDAFDWEDPEFVRANRGRYAYRVVPISQGYCMLVSPHDYKRMTTHKDGSRKRWRVKIDRDAEGNISGVYALRTGRGDEPKTVYAHRELLNCLYDKGEVDHLNGTLFIDRMEKAVRTPLDRAIKQLAQETRESLEATK